jgi:ABC-type transport system involved in multi-copper enzyme maturation permease subunit
MNKIFLIAWITFKDCLRNKVLYGIFFLGLILFTTNIVFTGMFTWELGKVAVDMGLSIISFSGLIIIFFMCLPLMSSDLVNKTVYLILSRPVTRAHYIIGKFVGLGAVIVISSFFLGVCSALSVRLSVLGAEVFIPAHFSWGLFAAAVGFITLSLLVLLALSILWTCVSSHHFTAVLLTLMTYFICQNMENVKNIILSTRFMAKDALPIKVIGAVSWILPNLAAFNLKTTAAYGLSVDMASQAWIFLYGVSYIVISITVAVVIFKRRELA